MTKISNWKEAAERALNGYFNIKRKTDNLSDAEEMFDEEMTGSLADAGIDCDCYPYDIPTDVLEEITDCLTIHLVHLSKEFPQFHDGILGPFHTYFIGVLYEIAENSNKSDEEKNKVKTLEKNWLMMEIK